MLWKGEVLKLNKEKVFLAMARKGISRKELSENSSVSDRTIQRLLTGKHNANSKTLWKLASALCVDVTEIIDIN